MTDGTIPAARSRARHQAIERTRIWQLLCAVFLIAMAMTLTGCDPKPEKPMVVGITGYNFTAEGVQAYFVDGRWGSNLPPYGGGGKTSCCASLPREWTPTLEVTVDWTMGDWTLPYRQIEHLTTKEQIACCWKERTLSKSVPVERYGKEGGGLQVFFLPGDAVKVYVTDYDLGHESHPSGMAYPRKPPGFE